MGPIRQDEPSAEELDTAVTTDSGSPIRPASLTTMFIFPPRRGNLWAGKRSIEAAVRGSGGTCGRLTQRIAALPLSRRGRAAARPPAARRRRDPAPALFLEKGFRSSHG